MLGPFGNAIVTDNAIAGRRGPLDRRLERVFKTSYHCGGPAFRPTDDKKHLPIFAVPRLSGRVFLIT